MTNYVLSLLCQYIQLVFRSGIGPKTCCLRSEFRPVWFEILCDNKLRIIYQTRSCVEECHGDVL